MQGHCNDGVSVRFRFWWMAVVMAVVAALIAAPVVADTAAEDPVGVVVSARGAASAVGPDGRQRLLGENADIFAGDRINTAAESFVVIVFVDSAQITVRPDSELVVDEYVYRGEDSDSSVLRLVRGGLRAVTGLIGGNNPGKYEVHSEMSVLGFRGTRYDTRICDEYCSREEAGFDDGPVRPSATCLDPIEGMPPGQYTQTHEGIVFHARDDGVFEIRAGEVGYAGDAGLGCVSVVPQFLLEELTPMPDSGILLRDLVPGLECRI